MNNTPAISVREVGLRDGLQSIARTLPTEHKLAWLRAAHAAGLREIEVGSFVPARLLPQLADLGNHSPWLGLLRLVMTEGREAPEIARLHRERVLDPLAAQIQKWAQIAAARGEINGDALQRIPLLLLSPAILATLWNGLYPEDPMNAAAAFEGFLDMVFGVPADPD